MFDQRARVVAHDDLHAVVAEQLVESTGQVGLGAQVQPEGIDRELVEPEIRRGPELHLERRDGAGRGG